MLKMLKKEMKLSASLLSYLFILFGAMFLIPGYPILCGAFFVTLGVFQSFQNAMRENDIIYTVLLPVAKSDVVKGKYLFSCLIELCGLLLMAIATAVRMTALAQAPAYRGNAMMNANGFALGMACVIFGLFNSIFIAGFFKTAYKITAAFIRYVIAAFMVIGIGEALWHIPGLEALNAFGTDHIGLQLLLLAGGILLGSATTCIAYRCACRRFAKIDL